jgi:hypothetical protein
MWEYISYLDTLFYDMWINCADIGGMGLGLGLIITSLLTKSIFAPVIIYSVIILIESHASINLLIIANGGHENEVITARFRRNDGKYEEIFLIRSNYFVIYIFTILL